MWQVYNRHREVLANCLVAALILCETRQVSFNNACFFQVKHVELCVFKLRYADSNDFLLSTEKKKQNIIEWLQKLTGTILFAKHSVKLWFWHEKRGASSITEKVLDDDDGQTQLQLAEQLNMSESTVSDCLKVTGKILEIVRSRIDWNIAGESKKPLQNVVH